MRRLTITAFVALVLAVPASAATTTFDARGVIHVDGRPVFPLALLKPPPLDGLTPWGTEALDELAGAGVNLFGVGPFGTTWTDEALLDAERWNAAAAERGVHTWLNQRELARAQPGTPEEERLRHVVETAADDAGLALWKGADEPFLSGWSPAVLSHAYATTRALDPARLTLLIHAPVGKTGDLRPYAAVGDVASVDVYPVRLKARDPRLHEVGIWTRRLGVATPHRAITTTLGICFSGSFGRGSAGPPVTPSPDQARYMAYDAILNGARGLIFYGGHVAGCLGPRDALLGWNWRYWSTTLRRLVEELGPRGRIYPALTSWTRGPAVRSSDPGTQVLARRAGRDVWVIAARHARGEKAVTLRGLPRWATRAAVYGEQRAVSVRRGVLRDTFARWDVHVYRLRAPG